RLASISSILLLTIVAFSARFCLSSFSSLFFFTDPAPTEIYTLSLHDALPISCCSTSRIIRKQAATRRRPYGDTPAGYCFCTSKRSEEHTSELQSRRDLVCRLLLEKKKKTTAQRDYNIQKTWSVGHTPAIKPAQ